MKKLIALFLMGVIVILADQGWAKGDPSHGKQLYSICVGCHGNNGQGRKINNAPRISGQTAWYLVRQLTNYRDGLRGIHINDITGLQMRSMAITLKSDKDILDVATYVSGLKSETPKSVLSGNLIAGKLAYKTCVTCHGENGKGNKVLNAPSIAGLQDWYVVRQLGYFREGIRGRLQKDTYGQQMRPMAIPLDDETIINLAVYIASLESNIIADKTSIASSSMSSTSLETMMVGAVLGSLESSEPFYSTCAACHGANAEGKRWLGAPRLSNQNDWYLERQLLNWKNGIRGTHPEDVFGMQMRPMSMTLKDNAAVKKVVAYIKTLKSPKPKKTIEGDTGAGQSLYSACIACHGPSGMGNIALNAPKIAGLPDWYVVRQLKAFHASQKVTVTVPNFI